MKIQSYQQICSLCENSLLKEPILDGELSFCCSGCHAVYHILDAKKELDSPFDHPVFKQAVKYGLIANPDLLDQIGSDKSESEEALQKIHLEIRDMWCPSCAELIQLVLMQYKGVVRAVIDYATDLAVIEFHPRILSKERILQEIQGLGYDPCPLESTDRRPVTKGLWFRFGVAAFCSLNVMMFSYPLYATYFNYDDLHAGPLFAWLSFFVSLPVLLFSGWPIYRRFLAGLSVGLWGMETLVVMGVGTAFVYSTYELVTGGSYVYFDSMTVIILFVLLGKIIESKAKFSAKDSLLRLVKATPRRGRKKFMDGTQHFVPIKEFQPGDLVIAKSGEMIVLDGLVVEGTGYANESLMTGEAVPVAKGEGSQVLGGTILQSGYVIYKVVRNVENSALCRIIDMVDQTPAQRTRVTRWADPVVHLFVPVVLGCALASGSYVGFSSGLEAGLLRAISVLLISCPCAIGIAAPLAESHIMNVIAHCGGFVRNRGCLQHLGKETVFVFDKTGTVTKGNYSVLEGLENLSQKHKRILKGAASRSNHPVSKAIFHAIGEDDPTDLNTEEIAGKGMRTYFRDELYLLGSAALLDIHKIPHIQQESGSCTTVYFSDKTQVLAEIKLGDGIREQAQALIRKINPIKTVLLSGDGKAPVEAVATACGFQCCHWGKSPLEKQQIIEELKAAGETVCFIGDGLNDAPALSSAHTGISVVSAADLSVQVSDILLTTDRIDVIEKISRVSREGHKVVYQNIFWAFFYNIIGVALAMGGLLTPVYAAFAMVASSLIVIFNAQRISWKNHRTGYADF